MKYLHSHLLIILCLLLIMTRISYAACSLLAQCEWTCCIDASVAGCHCVTYGDGHSECTDTNVDYSHYCGGIGSTNFYLAQQMWWTCTPGDSTCGCFLPGTQIATPSGTQKIETLKPGDAVTSVDPKTNQLTTNTVNQSLVSQRDSYYVIKTQSGKEVKVTAEHPFYTGTQTQPPKTIWERVRGSAIQVVIYLKDGWHTVTSLLSD